jgi:ATP phosphoribosyltransferase
MSEPIKIAYAYNQKTIATLLSEAGWVPEWIHGHQWTDTEDPKRDTLPKGTLIKGDKPVADIYGIRSIDIPRRVSLGSRDIGLVGTDNLREKKYPRIVEIGKVSLGRTFITPPALEVWVMEDSPIKSLADITPNVVVQTERPNFTLDELQKHGHRAVIEPINVADPREFRRKAALKGFVAIEIIGGAGPQQLENNEALVIVNETGDTKKNYKMREIGKLCDIDTIIIANEESLQDPEKRQLIERFTMDLEGVYAAIEAEANHASISLDMTFDRRRV